MLIDTFANRLQKALDINDMKPSDLSKKTGLDKSLISNYLSGNYKAKQDKLSILANALNVNETWLMGYDVNIEVANENDNNIEPSILDNVLYTNKNKIDSVKNLPIEKQEIIANAVKSVLDMIDEEDNK